MTAISPAVRERSFSSLHRRGPPVRLLAAFFVPLSETSISLPKNFVPPSVIGRVMPFDKGIPFWNHQIGKIHIFVV